MLMQGIMGKVRNHLAEYRQIQSSLSGDSNVSGMCPRASCQYFLDDSQIQHVVEIVFQEMCNNSSDLESTSVTQHKSLEGASGKLLATRKPSCLTKAIEPHASTTAGPATTINEPQTSFFTRSSSDGLIRAKIRSPQAPLTTIISRQSITDIRWLANMQAGIIEPEHQSLASDTPKAPAPTHSDYYSTTVNVSSIDDGPGHAPIYMAEPDTPNFHGFSMDSRLVNISKQQESAKIDISEENKTMTSFPTLPTRHCTIEWQSPLDSCVTTGDHGNDDIYYLGIDARLVTSEIETRMSTHSPEPPKSLKSKPSFMQRITRKISSVFQNPRSSGATRVPAPSESDEPNSAGFTETCNARHPDAEDEDEGPVLGYFSETEPDEVYKDIPSSRQVKLNPQRRSTCSEDNLPHVCVAESSTPTLPTANRGLNS